jgi:hypothetical protein
MRAFTECDVDARVKISKQYYYYLPYSNRLDAELLSSVYVLLRIVKKHCVSCIQTQKIQGLVENARIWLAYFRSARLNNLTIEQNNIHKGKTADCMTVKRFM